jgi:class 3 adenylate cyclase
MSSEQFRRHLAALMSADVVGYSRLMADDEIGTIRALTTCRDKITEIVKTNRGRLVDFVGDNMLTEFSNTLSRSKTSGPDPYPLKSSRASRSLNTKYLYRKRDK